MTVIQKRIGSMAASINVDNKRGRIHVRGHVYPFAERFFSASFSIEYAQTGDPSRPNTRAEVSGFNGNSFKLDEAFRMIEATKVAYDQATYYKNLIETLGTPKLYASLLRSLLDGNHSEPVIEALLLTPSSVEPADLEEVLSRLNKDPRHLGINKCLLELPESDLHLLTENSLAVLDTLFGYYSEYGDYSGDVADLLHVLRMSGVLN